MCSLIVFSDKSIGYFVTPQSLESQEKKEDLNFKERLDESKEGLGESKRDPG